MTSIRCPNCSHQLAVTPGPSGSESSIASHPATLPRSRTPDVTGARRRTLLGTPPFLSRSTSANGDVYNSMPRNDDVIYARADEVHPRQRYNGCHSNGGHTLSSSFGNGRLFTYDTIDPVSYTRSQSERFEYHVPYRDIEPPIWDPPLPPGDQQGDQHQGGAESDHSGSYDRSRARTRNRPHIRTRSAGSTLPRERVYNVRRNGQVIGNGGSGYTVHTDYEDEVFANDLYTDPRVSSSQYAQPHQRTPQTPQRVSTIDGYASVNNHRTYQRSGSFPRSSTTPSPATPTSSTGSTRPSTRTFPPRNIPPRAADIIKLNPALSHIDFWPSALQSVKSAFETDFEEFE